MKQSALFKETRTAREIMRLLGYLEGPIVLMSTLDRQVVNDIFTLLPRFFFSHEMS